MVNANIAAEQSVIGVIMLNAKDAMPIAALELSENDFYIPELRNIFSVCKKLFLGNKPVDATTVLSVLGNQYWETIRVASETTPMLSNFASYVEAVKKQSQKIQAYQKTMELLQALDDSNEEISYQSRASDVLSCFDDTQKDDTVSIEQGILEFYDRQSKPVSYIPTGFGKLDQHVYIDHGDFVIIGGRPSSGKTALTLQMMMSMAKGNRVAYFSFETGAAKIYDRIISNDDMVSLNRIKQHNPNEDELERVANKFNEQRNKNIFVVSAAGYTVPQIKSKAMQLQADIIFIDYLTLINAKGNSLYERATNISMDLHTLAQTSNMAVIALSQLNRAGKSEADMTSLRESGQIEQDADVIMLLEYDEKIPNERKLSVVKNKEGKAGHFKLKFEGQYQRFSEIETRYEE